MNRKVLIFALLCSILLLNSLPAAAAKKTTKKVKPSTDTTQTKVQDVQQEGGELVLLPELLNRLEGLPSDDSDLGPELPQNTKTSDDSSDKSSDDEPNMMDMEDDSDEIANIYKEEQAKSLLNEDTPENQEKSLLNEGQDTSNTNLVPNNGDAEVEQADLGKSSPTNWSDQEIGLTAVDVDGAFHDFEVQPCTLVEIPINKHKVQVRVTGTFNADLVMLTDGQFNSCSQLASFECPEDALFCRKQSLAAEDNEDIELDQEACGIENVYLYVLPADAAISLGYAVKVEDFGEAQCEDNSEPQISENAQEEQEGTVLPPQEDSESEEENSAEEGSTDEDSESSDQESTVLPSQEDSESEEEDSTDDEDSDSSDQESTVLPSQEDSESEEDSTDEDSTDEDSTDDKENSDSESSDEEINDDQILEATAEIDGKFHAFDLDACTVLEIPINQQSVNVTVNGIFNTDKVMLTDTKLTSCSMLNQFRCASTSDYCTIQSLQETANVEVCSEAAYIDTLYLYVFPESFEGIVSYQIKTSLIDQTECSTQDAGDDSAVTDGNSPAADDSTDASDASDDENNDGQTATPTVGDNTDDQILPDPSQTIGGGPSKINGWGIMGIIFGVSLFIFMAVVCIYRRQFKRNRVELFHPPSWCPMCLFPREEEGLISQETRDAQFEFNEYEPPVL